MPERWIVPGGSVEPEEDSSMAAMREVEEEAGVRGNLDGIIGVFEVCVACLFYSYPSLLSRLISSRVLIQVACPWPRHAPPI
jgi:8-oxo-dGTP pyrophosphatase MutT (NUDIX family)